MDNSRARKKYLSLMWEIEKRLEVLKALISGEADVIYLKAQIETEALQLRKVLELIAYSSLVCHQEQYRAIREDIAKDWHAKRIVNKIKTINPRFYPIPTKGCFDGYWKDVKSGFLTLKQFQVAYDSCGDILHIKNPFSKVNKSATAFHKRVPEYIDRIEKLLSQHRVYLPDNYGIIHVLTNFGSESELKLWWYGTTVNA
jgi:hypothetical protein